jgi:bacterioferritin (cytochrome b1)
LHVPLSDDERWLLSYYRTSEINGALFFGRLARTLKSSPIQHDLTKHFADEAQHAWYWTDCLDRLGVRPIKLSEAYQDQYLEAAGVPANLMEVMAITLVFERRVINQYAKHLAAPELRPEVKETIDRIMADERWHVQWVRDALAGMEERFGQENVADTLRRFKEADRQVYAKTLEEHEARLGFLLSSQPGDREHGHRGQD